MGQKQYNRRETSPEPGQARRLAELESENARLKDEVAILTLDKLILEEVAEENGRGDARK